MPDVEAASMNQLRRADSIVGLVSSA